MAAASKRQSWLVSTPAGYMARRHPHQHGYSDTRWAASKHTYIHTYTYYQFAIPSTYPIKRAPADSIGQMFCLRLAKLPTVYIYIYKPTLHSPFRQTLSTDRFTRPSPILAHYPRVRTWWSRKEKEVISNVTRLLTVSILLFLPWSFYYSLCYTELSSRAILRFAVPLDTVLYKKENRILKK